MPKLSRRTGALIGRFLAAERGATAVEFAFVAAPALLILFALLNLGFIFSISSSLDNAVAQTARQIRTGDAQSKGVSADQFKALICQNLAFPGSSCGNLQGVDVRAFSCFKNVTPPPPLVGGQVDQANLMFNMGGPGDIIVVRAYYQWPLLAPGLMASASSSMSSVMLTSATTFRNEPYGQTSPTPPSCT